MTDTTENAVPATGTESTTASTAPAAGAETTTPNAAAVTPPEEGEAESKTEEEEGSEQKTEAAPEQYELVAPEGVTLDAEVLSDFEATARELNLSNESAQKLVSLAAKLQEKWQAENTALIETTKAQWLQELAADKELGGQKSAEKVAVAAKAVRQFGSPALLTLLDATGLGNHPEVIRAFYNIGKATGEDSDFVAGNAPKTVATTAKRLYPNSNMN